MKPTIAKVAGIDRAIVADLSAFQSVLKRLESSCCKGSGSFILGGSTMQLIDGEFCKLARKPKKSGTSGRCDARR